jgi:hypothetical protein
MPSDIKTDPKLLARLKEVAGKPLSAAELRAQRVSFIMGGMSKEAHVTRARVEEILDNREGRRAKG